MIYQINEENPQQRLIDKAVEILEKDGVIIYPTDTVYAYGCDINCKKAIETIYRLKKIDNKKPLSFVFTDISQMKDYIRNMSDKAYKVMKKVAPGPYTFIFNASKLIPKLVTTKQKTIGVRIPDNNITRDLVQRLGRPILSASVNTSEGEYIIEPGDLEKVFRNEVDLVIDAGPKYSEPSTVIDFTSGDPLIVREGKGEINF